MYVSNNPNIFYMAAGLVAAKEKDEYTYWNTFDGYIYDLIEKINEISINDYTRDWFRRAETGQVNVNPYWPRGSAMHSATFFLQNDDFNVDEFLRFYYGTGVRDPVGDEDFRSWIMDVPRILSYMKGMYSTSSAWEAWCAIVENRKTDWESIAKNAQEVLSEFFVNNAPKMLFSPNLLIHFCETNFVHLHDSIVTIAYQPDVESMIHEALHTEVSKHRDIINTLHEAYKINDFFDYLRMLDYGYLHQFETQEENTASYLHVVEECLVRGISTVLAGGGERRLAAHANSGFGCVPYIGRCFTEKQPNAAQLGDFISNVIRNFA